VKSPKNRIGLADLVDHDRLALSLVAALMAVVVLVGGLAIYSRPPVHRDEVLFRWGPSFAVTSGELFSIRPRPGDVMLTDEELVLGALWGVRSGTPFQQAQHDMFARNPGRWNTTSPLSYRQPLLTYVWLVLGSGALIGIAWSLLAAGSMYAAWACARRLVNPLAAVVAPAGLCLVYSFMLWHNVRLLYTEMWAGPLVVIAAANCALALGSAPGTQPRRAWVYAAAGASAGLLAMLTRELAVAPVLVMVLALLADRRARQRLLWVPWAWALALWAGQYAWHARQVALVSTGDSLISGGVRIRDYFAFRPSFLSACLRSAASEPYLLVIVAFLCVMACFAAFTVRTNAMRILTGGLTLATLVMMVVSGGPPGWWADGTPLGYWGYLFVPYVIAWAPLALRVIPRFRPSGV